MGSYRCALAKCLRVPSLCEGISVKISYHFLNGGWEPGDSFTSPAIQFMSPSNTINALQYQTLTVLIFFFLSDF